jgi:DNA transformation protein and related proteins
MGDVSRETRFGGLPRPRGNPVLSHQALFPAAMPPPSDLPGLGPKSLAMLAAAGIHRRADLESLGSVQAYLRVKAAGQNASLNLLWAMEGALTGEAWRVVAREERTRLLMALDAAQEAARR